ncbi:uncharacterized protein LOC118413143 [Branchiostoma floridae]|uniref:Uncharacterized protein LOC118413143 n=1 Tax=Branchiostoma floridae TaxID=7739 RepID=A0A9J7KXP7_BRAFL|nr:uncharacterized protein LOC118413143 [Branchiostoma floridae]
MRKKGNVDLKPRSQLPPGGPRALKPDVPPPPPPRSPLKTSGSADSTPPPPPRSPLKPPGSADSTGTGTATDKHIHHVRGGEKPATFPRLENLNRTKSNQYSKLKLPAFDDGVTSRSSGDISGGRSQTSPQEEPASHAVDESRSRHTLPADVGRTGEETEDQFPPPIPVSIRKQRYRIRSTEVTSLDETASNFPDKPPPLPKKKRKSLPHLFRQISHSSEAPSAGKSSLGTRRTSLPTPTGATKTFRQTSVPSMDDPEGPDQEVVRHWTRKDVKAWIKASWPKHLTTYRKKFYSKKIDGEALLALTEERLAEELKVQQPEDRSAIMELVKTLRTAGSKESFVDEQDEEMFHAGPLYQNSEMQEEHQDTAGAEAHGAEAEAQGAGIMRGRTRSLWRNFSMVKKDARVEQLQDKEVALQEVCSNTKGDSLPALRNLVKELKQSFHRDVLMTEFLTLDTYNRYFMDYHTYCRTAVYQQALLQKLLQASGEFAVRIDQLEIYPRCCGNRLDSFLKIPQQHITKLKTVFEGILRHAPKGSSEERSAYEIIKAMEKTIKTCEEAVAAMTESLELQEKLTFRKTKEVEVASPDRWLERVGEFSELRGGRISSPEAPVLMFLFNDMILITRREATDGLAVQDYAPRRLLEVLSVGQALCRAFGMEDLYQITLAANHRGVMEELVLHPETSDDVDLLLSVPVSDEQVSNDTDEDVEYGVITESFSITDTADKPIVFEEGDVVKIYGHMEDLETRVHAVRMTDGQVGVLPGHVIGMVSGESGGYGSRERCTSATVVPKNLSTTQRDPVITTRVPRGSDGNQSPNTSISEYSHFDALWSLAQERLDASVNDSSDKFNVVSSNFAAGVLVKELKQSFHRDVLMTEFLTLGTYNRYFMDYHTYCRTAVYQQALLQKLLQASGEFAVRIDQLEIYPRCCGNRLDSFLKIPQQHITKLKTVFEGILRHAPKGSSEERSAYEIIKAMEKTIKTCEEAVAAMTESLELQEKLTFRKTKEVEVASPDRWLERVGEFSELRGGRISSPEAPVLMFLFNDMILITRREATDGLAVQDYAPRRLVEVLSVGQALCRAFGMEDLYQITLAANHRGVMEELVLHPETSDDVDLLLSVPVSDEQVSNDTDEDVEYGVITESFSITDTADKPIVFEEGDVVKIYGGLEDLETRVHAVRMTDGQVGVLPGHVIGVVSGESGGYGSRERCTSATVVPKNMSTTQRDPVITTRVPSMVLVPRVPSLVRTKTKGSSLGGSDGNQSPNTSISEYSHFDALWNLAQERLDASVNDSSDKFNVVSSNFAAGVFDELGGHLSILEKGISLFIPPGAIAGGPTKIYIYLESIDVHQDETLPEGQAMMSSTLYCGPPGTQFDEDVVFTLPYQGTGCDAMWNVFPVQTQTAVGETPDWRSLTDDDQAMHFLSNGFCTYFVSHFTGFGVVGDCSRSDGARVKIFRFGAFASPREMRGRNRRVRVRCWEGKKSELERVLQLEECEHSGKLIDAHRPLPLREGRGDVWMAATDTAAGWQLRGCGEQSIPEILLWMEEEEPVDSSCTFEFNATNDKPGRFGCTVKIYQEETPKTLVRLNASDSEETQQESSSGPPNEPPNLRFLRLQPELQPIKQDGALLPPSAHRQICAVLDVHSPLGNDWRAFAEKLGLPFDTICWVEGKRPTARLLYYWEHTNAGGGSSALRNLKRIFQELEREDVTEILSEVIPLYSTEHPESYREGRRSTEPSGSGRNERSDKEQCSPRKFSDSVFTMSTKDRSRMLKKGGSKDNLDVQSSRVSQRLSESTRAISVF